jgi:hypothetical protein
MTYTLKRLVYCHDIINPPKQDRGSDINLILTQSNNQIILKRIQKAYSDRTFVTPYSVEIPDPISLGFTSSDQVTVNREFGNLLLTFNLLLNRVCVLGTYTSFPEFDITPDNPESQSHVEKKGNTYKVSLIDSIVIRDSIFVEIGTKENIEEYQIAHLFNKIQRCGRLDINYGSNIQMANLSRSFSEYEEAMSNFETLYKFKYLFNSLEYSINIDGTYRKDDEFDSLYESLVKVPNTKLVDWRGLYNRCKHPQRNQADVNKYFNGIENLADYILALRNNCSDLLLQRLDELS